jgi:hypothetical protein
MKAIELTAEAVLEAVKSGATSLTGISKALGLGKGSVSGSTAKEIRALVPDVEDRLAANKASKGGTADVKADAKVKPVKAAKVKPVKAAKSAKVPLKAGKWPHDSRNPFREGSSYAICFNILAANKAGLAKEKLVELLAEATGKDIKHAGYDAQVLLSAHPNDNGLSNNDSPRHRSCRPGFWIQRTNGHVKLMVG